MPKTAEAAHPHPAIDFHPTDSTIALSLTIIQRRRGQSVYPGTYRYEPSKSGPPKRERWGQDTKMHASQSLHFSLKDQRLLAQVIEEYEYRQSVRAGNLSQTPEDARPGAEEKKLQKAIDTLEACMLIPPLQTHAAFLLDQLRCRDPYTIDMGLCVNQFLEWVRSNPFYFHFGPRATGEIHGTLDHQNYVIKGTRIDDLILVLKQTPTKEQTLLLEAIRKAGKGELGWSAPEVVAHCYRNTELRCLAERLMAVEFKLGSPDQFGPAIKSHQQQAISNTGLINSALEQSLSSFSYQSPLLTMEEPEEFEPVTCQLIYFAPQETTVHNFRADELDLDQETLRDAIERTQLGQRLPNHASPC